VIFGVIVVVAPDLELRGLVFVFGAYARSDGAFVLIVALSVTGAAGFGSLMFEALVRPGMGLLDRQKSCAINELDIDCF
jgi:hypothetical protein